MNAIKHATQPKIQTIFWELPKSSLNKKNVKHLDPKHTLNKSNQFYIPKKKS